MDQTAVDALGLAGQRAAEPLADIAADRERAAAHSRAGKRPAAPSTTDDAARHAAPDLDADVADNADRARSETGADAVKPLRAALEHDFVEIAVFADQRDRQL